jgi:hypothetical protein
MKKGLEPRALMALVMVALKSQNLSLTSLKEGLRQEVARDPMDAVAKLTIGSSVLFFLAEKGHNPKVTSIWDALVFCSTCLSVGYATVFAETPAGKAIATLLMTVGPSMTASLLNPPGGEAPDPQVQKGQELIASKLDAILEELKKSHTQVS